MQPWLRNITIGLGGSAVTVAIYFSSILGSQYQGAILSHLEDIINGTNTTVAVSLNAPNWGFGIPIPTPQLSSIATSSNPTAASGLASSTPYTFAVVALDGTGTTTLSNPLTITTDASNTQPLPEDIQVKWANVNGATGYAIFFATSSNATKFTQYFLATTSTQYTFATSTGSIAGSYTRNTTTAFTELLNPNGPDIFNDNTPNATSSIAASTTALQVGGTVDATASATTTACESDTAGSVFFNQANKHEWGCDGTTWNKIF
jgi:hypothetical protein